MTQVRDEAHRFAITQHRKRRTKIAVSSDLESIPGIGPTLRKKLLQEFGGLDGLRQASLVQLQNVKGMRKASAIALHSYFQGASKDAKPDENTP